MAVQALDLSRIRTDGDTQPRAELSLIGVAEFAEALRNGDVFPPITVFFDGIDHWLADGFHRFLAYEREGYKQIPADVRHGTLDDARWFSYGANATHGLRRTNEDKARAVKAALLHPKAAGLSDRELAGHVGVSAMAINRARNELKASVPELQIAERSVTRNGVTYSQNTANIGRRSAAVVDEAPDEGDEPFEDPAEMALPGFGEPTFEPDLQNAGAVADERARAQAIIETALDIVPGARERVSAAELRRVFAEARVTVGSRLLDLNPDALVVAIGTDEITVTRHFIDRCRRWLDQLDAALGQPIRAIK